MATLAGSVHGVVVQMTMLAFPARGPETMRELDKNRGIHAVRIFHLRLRERRLRPGAPVDWLLALVNEPLFHERGKSADDLRLVSGRERQVRILPVAEHAEPPELLALDIDELARICLAISCRMPAAKDRANSLTTLNSIGRPWQSQPGT